MAKVLPGPLDWSKSEELAEAIRAGATLDGLIAELTQLRSELGNVYIDIETVTCWVGREKVHRGS